MSIAKSLLNVLDSCSLSEAKKKKKTKKIMHDSFPVLVVESIPFLNFKDEWLWVWVVPFPCVLLLMYDLFLGCLCIVQYKLELVIH